MSISKEDSGLYMGVINTFQVTAQLLANFLASTAISLSRGNVAYGIAVGGVFAFVGIFFVWTMRMPQNLPPPACLGRKRQKKSAGDDDDAAAVVVAASAEATIVVAYGTPVISIDQNQISILQSPSSEFDETRKLLQG